jgi:hypothetical protein
MPNRCWRDWWASTDDALSLDRLDVAFEKVFLLRRMSPELAQSGPTEMSAIWPLSGVKRTSASDCRTITMNRPRNCSRAAIRSSKEALFGRQLARRFHHDPQLPVA